jgi:hypothetical protein
VLRAARAVASLGDADLQRWPALLGRTCPHRLTISLQIIEPPVLCKQLVLLLAFPCLFAGIPAELQKPNAVSNKTEPRRATMRARALRSIHDRFLA